MSDLDEQIRGSLKTQHAELMDEDEDFESHLEGLKILFRGKLKWITGLHLLSMLVLCTMIVVSAVQFFRVESVRAMIGWATGFAVFVIVEAIVELIFVMEGDNYVIRREVKQIELQVASLTSEIRRQRVSSQDADESQ